ncbi:hypothetical protein D3C71_1483320 [compost metagenome]
MVSGQTFDRHLLQGQNGPTVQKAVGDRIAPVGPGTVEHHQRPRLSPGATERHGQDAAHLFVRGPVFAREEGIEDGGSSRGDLFERSLPRVVQCHAFVRAADHGPHQGVGGVIVPDRRQGHREGGMLLQVWLNRNQGL